MADVQRRVLGFLSAHDVIRLGCTSRELNRVCHDARLWTRLYLEDFLLGDADPSDVVLLAQLEMRGDRPATDADGLRSPASAALPMATGGSSRRRAGDDTAVGVSVLSRVRATASSVGADGSASGSLPVMSSARRAYLDKYKERMTTVRRIRAEQEAKRQDNMAKIQRVRLRWYLDLLVNMCGYTLPVIVLFVALMLVLSNLDAAQESRPLTTPWSGIAIMIAVSVLMVLVAVALLVYQYSRRHARGSSPWKGQWEVEDRQHPLSYGVREVLELFGICGSFLRDGEHEDACRVRVCRRVLCSCPRLVLIIRRMLAIFLPLLIVAAPITLLATAQASADYRAEFLASQNLSALTNTPLESTLADGNGTSNGTTGGGSADVIIIPDAGVSWLAACVPVFGILALLPLAVLIVHDGQLNAALFAAMTGLCVCVSAPLIVLTVLVALLAEGFPGLTAVDALTPVWVMDGLVIAGATVGCCCYSAMEFRNRSSFRSDILPAWLSCCFGVGAFVASVVTFELLIALKVDALYTSNWFVVATPILLFICVIVLMVAALGCVRFLCARDSFAHREFSESNRVEDVA